MQIFIMEILGVPLDMYGGHVCIMDMYVWWVGMYTVEAPSVLLGKMGLISDRLARLEKRQISKSSEALKSKDCVSFCLSTDSYRVAIKRSLNCQTSVQLLPLSSYLDLLFGNASSGFNYIAYALPYRCNEAV